MIPRGWVLGSLLLLAFRSQALADGTIYEGPNALEDQHEGPALRLELCEAVDPECSTRILRVLSGINYARTRLIAGPLLSPAAEPRSREDSGGFQVTAIDTHSPLGDLSLARFEMTGLTRADPVRSRLTLAQSEVIFFCHDDQGKLHPPAVGRMEQYCTPDASAGLGFRLLELQADPTTHRFAARWGEATGVYNLLGNGHGLEYVRQHVNLVLGTSLETSSQDGSRTRLRGLAGVSALWRTPNSHWEVTAWAGYRPNLVGPENAFKDIAAEARVSLLRHILLSRSIMVSAGLAGEASYWQSPRDSIGTFASDRQRDTYFVGFVLGGSFEFTDI